MRVDFKLGLALWALLLSGGCASIEKRYDSIRERETALFEGHAQIGTVSNSGDMIFWTSATAYPVLATPTTFHFNTNSIPYTSIEGTRVGSFRSKAFLFEKERVYEDLLILDRGYSSQTVFQFIPANRKWKQPHGGPEQRALAEKAALVIEERRAAVDAFGLEYAPQPVGLAVWPGLVFELWTRNPVYLKERFSEETAAIDALFKSSREALSGQFMQSVGAKAASGDAFAQGYALTYIGAVKINWVRHGEIRKRLGEKAGGMNRFVVLDVPRIFLEEKLDPYGNPSVKARFSFAARFYDSSNSRLASIESFSYEVTQPLSVWLEGGAEPVQAELAKAIDHLLVKLWQTLNRNGQTSEPS